MLLPTSQMTIGKKNKPVSSDNRNNADSLVAIFLNEFCFADIFLPDRCSGAILDQVDKQVKQHHWLSVEEAAHRNGADSAIDGGCRRLCRAVTFCDAGKRHMPDAGMQQKTTGSVVTPRTSH
jgi:hypothetical protein